MGSFCGIIPHTNFLEISFGDCVVVHATFYQYLGGLKQTNVGFCVSHIALFASLEEVLKGFVVGAVGKV
jgi:hypothetical protein